MINNGCFKDLDICLMVHPADKDELKPPCLAVEQVKVIYHDHSSPAAAFPWNGVNALDAAVMAYTSISVLRQQMKPKWRVHGIITEGGVKPNIIPDRAQIQYYIRAPTDEELDVLKEKIINCFEAAATATGYSSLDTNDTLADLYQANVKTLGVTFNPPKIELSGSTDMGNVSQIIPSIHVMYSIGSDAVNHSRAFTSAAITEIAHEKTLIASKAMAMTAIDQLVNMDSQKSENISQFTTENSTANPGDVIDASAIEGGSPSWDADVEIEIPASPVLKVFLGDCENRLVLVKIHEAPAELPDTAVIGRLSHYGRVLSFRRDKIAQHIENGVRTARLALHRTIPADINIAGEPIKIWYPNQPKACRNCGATDHMAKDCSAVRCFNCECPGHRAQECKDPPRCSVCLVDSHSMPQCPFLLFSANVDNEPTTPTPPKTEEEKKQEQIRRAKEREERQKKLQQQREQQRQREEQRKQQEQQKTSERDESRKERPRERNDRQERRDNRRDDREERRDDRRDGRRERDRDDRDYYYRGRDDRDSSSRRDYSCSETDDDGWQRVNTRRRRYIY
ncbi:Peptidase M20 domain-containing protein 2 [Stylophora pistillata]|uniref:Peptidase M20 domain-containing protein 2 n=2 Tax=Stylophora pistillata TaxID=50429 RepID=A0A2B4RI88_STYPI|nr:Peptidase M20 domain-containing protein 2 [Stylophora pistillata]